MREIDARVRNSPIAEPSGAYNGGTVVFRGKRDGRDERSEVAPREVARVLGRDAERHERPQPGDDRARADEGRVPSPLVNVADAIARRSAEVLRLVSIDPVHLDSYPHQLSGGMRQRSMIAMALLFTPQLVVMDEPTSALDVVAQRSLMRQIKALQDRLGFAVIFVTHDISLVRHFSDRLLVMYAGQVAELGATAEVFGTPRHPYSRALLEAFPSIRGEKVALTGIAGAPPNLASPPSGCRFHPRCADAMPSARPSNRRCTREVGRSSVACLYKDGAGATESLAGRLPAASANLQLRP